MDVSSYVLYSTQARIIRELKNVQRRATKLIPSLQNLPYYERLQNLNLPSLSYRRNCMDLIMTY